MTEDISEEIADFWVETVDESSGKPYFYHSHTFQPVWERPQGIIVLESELLDEELAGRTSPVEPMVPRGRSPPGAATAA